MSIRGIICLGLLDSPSEIITLGLDSAEVTGPSGPGMRTIANISKARTIAEIEKPRTIAELEK